MVLVVDTLGLPSLGGNAPSRTPCNTAPSPHPHIFRPPPCAVPPCAGAVVSVVDTLGLPSLGGDEPLRTPCNKVPKPLPPPCVVPPFTGAVVSVVDTLGLPVKFIGVGETAEDLQPFDPEVRCRTVA